MATSDKICHYIDLPLQHSCDDILKMMLREEREKDIRNIIKTIRTIIPDAAIRTAFIVGFPGEEKRHYEALFKFVQEMRFEHLGVFTYSNEEGTVAATLPNQIPEEIKIERREGIMQLQKKISRSLNKKREGTTCEALIEGFTSADDMLITARTRFQAPETDGVVFIEKSEVSQGELVKVKITRAMEYDLVGEVIR
jgi:ribosomal protein S12 methylthiotransferase